MGANGVRFFRAHDPGGIALPRIQPSQSLDDAVRNIDLVVRYEHLQQGFLGVCRQVRIPWEPLGTRSKAQRHHYRQYYDKRLEVLVGDLFREEIELFGYVF